MARIADCLDQIRLQEHGLRQETKGPSTTVERDLPVNISTSPQAGSVNAELDANDLTWKSTGFFHANLRADSGFNFREEGRLACRVLQEAPNLEQEPLGCSVWAGAAVAQICSPSFRGAGLGASSRLKGFGPGLLQPPSSSCPPGEAASSLCVLKTQLPAPWAPPWKATGLRWTGPRPLTYLTINLEQE